MFRRKLKTVLGEMSTVVLEGVNARMKKSKKQDLLQYENLRMLEEGSLLKIK
jgi:hypothetical protein